MPQRVFGMTRGVSLASIIRDKGALHIAIRIAIFASKKELDISAAQGSAEFEHVAYAYLFGLLPT